MNDPRVVEVGREVRRRRKELGLTIEQLAERADLTANYIASIERGERDPSLSTVASIARGLGVPIPALLGKTPELSPYAHEMAAIFDHVPRKLQTALSLILRLAIMVEQKASTQPKN